MLAIFCDTPGQLTAKDLPKPVRGEGEVLVRIRRRRPAVRICTSSLATSPIFPTRASWATSFPAPWKKHLMAVLFSAGDVVTVILSILRKMQRLPERQEQLLPQYWCPRRSSRWLHISGLSRSPAGSRRQLCETGFSMSALRFLTCPNSAANSRGLIPDMFPPIISHALFAAWLSHTRTHP